MKKTNSVEVKIIIAAIALMLSLFTAVIVKQVFEKENETIKFVYNYTPEQMTSSDNFNS